MAPGADRSTVLVHALEAGGIRCRAFELAGGRFVVAWPKSGAHDARYRAKVITAHHDRVPGTPGALDNSAACLQLVRFLSSDRGAFNTLVIFTDREEVGPATTTRKWRSDAVPQANDQGSYELGKAFSGTLAGTVELHDPMVCTLDVTGRGDALVLSRAVAGLAGRGMPAGSGAFDALIAETELMAAAVMNMMAGRAPVYRAPVPFGEDMGFILAGVPALAVTVLPRAEAERLADQGGLPAWASPVAPGARTPETWKLLHGSGDTTALYTDSAFGLVSRFLDRLSSLRVPAALRGSR